MHGAYRILIIEDEWIIIGLIEDILRELGYAVSGTAHNIQSACEELGKRNYGLIVFFVGLAYAFIRKEKAADNPWGDGATTLEWALTSPPPFHQYEVLPRIK